MGTSPNNKKKFADSQQPPDYHHPQNTPYPNNFATTSPYPNNFATTSPYPNNFATTNPYPDNFAQAPNYDETEEPLDSGKIYMSPDMDVDLRHRFIRKVFGILSVQLLFTTAIIAIFCFVNAVKIFLLGNIWIFYLSVIFSFIMLIIMVCIPHLLRKHPANLIIMCVFTFLESIALGFISSLYAREYLLMAIGTVALIVIALILFATQVKYDFTKWYPYLMVASLCMFVFMIFALIFKDKVVQYVFATLGMLLASMYIVFDTQMISGGKKYQLGEDEYMYGVLMLYVDIIMLYQYVLLLFGGSN